MHLLALVTAQAAPLDPLDYVSLGTGSFAAVTIDSTSGTMAGDFSGTGLDVGGTLVFVFDDVQFGTITTTGNRPVAILSHGFLTVTGDVLAAASGATPGPGGGAGAIQTHGSGAGVGPGFGGTGASDYRAGGGGAHGGSGGLGSSYGSIQPQASAYGTALLDVLTAGSGGGGATLQDGGAGGGAIELGAVGILSVQGAVDVRGAPGQSTTIDNGPGGGGGSGGSILLHGGIDSTCTGSLIASGGDGGSHLVSANGGGGGGGAGGRVVQLGLATACVPNVSGGLAGESTFYGGNASSAGGDGTTVVVADPDADGDGSARSVDCDDSNPDERPGGVVVIGDGHDNDCSNGGIGDECYQDLDGDGYGSATVIPSAGAVCQAPVGEAIVTGDCLDDEPLAYPGNLPELCDGVDNDCDGVTDDDATDRATWYTDGDVDGFGATPILACAQPPSTVISGGDCNDADPAVNPGALEVCNGVDDDNCVAGIDEGLTQDYWPDTDSDGFGDDTVPAVPSCAPLVDYVANNQDCDDGNATARPGGIEVCDGADNDCDGTADNGVGPLWYLDTDGDQFGVLPTVQACAQPPGYAPVGNDCNPTNDAIYPGAPEVCNGVDDNCNGALDDGVLLNFYLDADNDGYGNPLDVTQACIAPPQTVSDATDCDDDHATAFPGAPELCNERDDDCDTLIDEGLTAPFWFADADADGFGNVALSAQSCTAPLGYVSDATDCNDQQSTINPSANEVCNLLDDDCDTEIDEGFPDDAIWYQDADQDGFGNAFVPTIQQCAQPPGYVLSGNDCDDTNGDRHPGAIEVCGGGDLDCDGLEDDDDVVLPSSATSWWVDNDGDNYGAGAQNRTCEVPPDAALVNGDCADSNPNRNPAVEELCDLIDNDCDGLIDDADPGVLSTPYYEDLDQDHFGAGAASFACAPPFGLVENDLDCDDTAADVFPGADEPCDGVDHDCDGAVSGEAGWEDHDEDGFGDDELPTTVCGEGVPEPGDCDDGDPTVYPGAFDVLDDGIDQDCDGSDSTSIPPETGMTGDTGGPTDTSVEPMPTGTDGLTDSGCTCTHGPSGAPGLTGLALLGLGWLRRRR